MAAIHTADILTTWSGRGELLIFLIINMNHVPKDIYWILALLGQVKQTCNMQLDKVDSVVTAFYCAFLPPFITISMNSRSKQVDSQKVRIKFLPTVYSNQIS